MRRAEAEFGIPRLLDAHDLVHFPDAHSVTTYISLFARAVLSSDLLFFMPPCILSSWCNTWIY